MTQRRPSNRFGGLQLFGAWLILALLAAVVAFQLYNLILLAGTFIISQPLLRPSGWSMSTLLSISRFTVLVLVLIWLAFVTSMQHFLREWQSYHLLRPRAGLLAMLLVALGVATTMLQVVHILLLR